MTLPSSFRPLTERQVVVASHNRGKVRELADLLAPHEIKVLAAADLDLEEPEEIGATFAENASLKARAAASASGKPALADDSGLCVEALAGEPGLQSARWAGPSRDFALAMGRIHDALVALGTDNWRAHFVCVLALAWPDGTLATFEGRVWGTLVWPPRGNRGFGYDPLFVPDGHDETFGEMDPALKHSISHRARAFHELSHACLNPWRG